MNTFFQHCSYKNVGDFVTKLPAWFDKTLSNLSSQIFFWSSSTAALDYRNFSSNQNEKVTKEWQNGIKNIKNKKATNIT